jgi:hypothetical protein
MMAENKDKDQQVQAEGDSSVQTGGPGAGTSRESGFVHSSPEANVFPPGVSQSSHGAGGKPAPGHSAAGTPDEGRLGGAGGTSASGTTGNDPDR